jgi:hypothetical protein
MPPRNRRKNDLKRNAHVTHDQPTRTVRHFDDGGAYFGAHVDAFGCAYVCAFG